MPKSLTFKTDEILFNDNLGNGSCTIRDSSGTLDICGNLDISGTVGIYRNLDISGSTNIYGNLDVSGSTRLGKSGTPVVTLDISATDAIRIPVGTTGQRPTTQQAGQIRYNTTTSQFEGYNQSSSWQGLGGVIDIDQDTYIIAETNPLDDNDEIQIYTKGVERLKIDASGSTDIYGNLGVSGSLDISGSTNIYGNLDVSGSTRLGKSGTPVVTLDISATDAIRIPVGTTGQRPTTTEAGQIRYNTTTSQFEGYNQSSSWQGLGGVIDIDQDTYIIAETNPLDDNDEIQIYTEGVERLKIDASGSTDIYGNLGVSGSLDISGSTNIYGNLDVSGSTRLGKSGTPVVTLDISATDAIRIPVGTTGQRPTTQQAGQIRYNTTTSQFEGYNQSSSWQGLGGVIDIDQDTYIIAETNPLDDNDEIQIYTAGVQRLKIDASGSTDIYGNLDVSGDISCVDISAVFIDASNGNIKGNLIVGNLSLEDSGSFNYPTFKHKDITNSGSFALQQNSSGRTILNCATGQQIDFRVNNANRLTINSSGYLGIGTDTPERNLHVAGDISCVDISAQNIDVNNIIYTSGLVIKNLGLLGAVYNHGNQTIGGVKTFSDNVIIGGSLIVTGTMTTISTAHTIVNDPLMELGNGRSGTSHGDGGLIIERGDLSNVFLGWDESIAKFHLGTTEATGLSTGNINITTGTLVADISATDISCARLNVTGRATPNRKGGLSVTSDMSGGFGYDPTELGVHMGQFNNKPRLWLTTTNTSSVGQFFFGTGSGGSPGRITYYHSGTGVNADAMTFSTDSSERVRIDGTGNVGIGTTSPVSALHVSAAGPQDNTQSFGIHMGRDSDDQIRMMLVSNGGDDSIIDFKDTGDGGARGRISYNSGDDKMYFSTTAATNRMTINGTGNVGIGTTAPSKKLEVVGDISCGKLSVGARGAWNIYAINPAATQPSGKERLIISTEGGGCYIRLFNNSSASNAGTDASIYLNGGTGGAHFTGNVGIGTTAPSKKLEVVGDISCIDISCSSLSMSAGLNAELTYFKGGGDSRFLTIEARRSTENKYGARHVFKANADAGEFNFVNFSEESWLFLKHDGNVGIGTTSPQHYLHVYDPRTTATNTVDADVAAEFNVPGNTTNARRFVRIQALQHSGGNAMMIRAGNGTGSAGILYLYGGSQANNNYIRIAAGNVTASGTVGTWSDNRLKHNEVDISNALITINKLKPQFYIKTPDVKDSCGNEYSRNHNFTTNDLSNGLPPHTYYESGYLAQDVSNVTELNHLVYESEYDESGNPTPLGLNYTGIQPYLTKAIQELHALVLQQSQLISQQGQQILDLSAQVAALS
jgi:hypothetical protein